MALALACSSEFRREGQNPFPRCAVTRCHVSSVVDSAKESGSPDAASGPSKTNIRIRGEVGRGGLQSPEKEQPGPVLAVEREGVRSARRPGRAPSTRMVDSTRFSDWTTRTADTVAFWRKSRNFVLLCGQTGQGRAVRWRERQFHPRSTAPHATGAIWPAPPVLVWLPGISDRT